MRHFYARARRQPGAGASDCQDHCNSQAVLVLPLWFPRMPQKGGPTARDLTVARVGKVGAVPFVNEKKVSRMCMAHLARVGGVGAVPFVQGTASVVNMEKGTFNSSIGICQTGKSDGAREAHLQV